MRELTSKRNQIDFTDPDKVVLRRPIRIFFGVRFSLCHQMDTIKALVIEPLRLNRVNVFL